MTEFGHSSSRRDGTEDAKRKSRVLIINGVGFGGSPTPARMLRPERATGTLEINGRQSRRILFGTRNTIGFTRFQHSAIRVVCLLFVKFRGKYVVIRAILDGSLI